MNQKLVFVTGAGRGIGRTVALGLAQEGFKVWGCSRTESDLLETRRLSEDQIEVQTVDVSNPEFLAQWFREGTSQSDLTPWGLVTTAGIYGPIGPVVENSWEKWKESIEVNLYGTVLASQIFASHLVKYKSPGRIVMLSGGGATKPLPNFSSYCAAKAGVVRFCETIALELKPYGITANSIAPGAVNTQFMTDILKAGPEKAGQETYEAALKQEKSGGTPPTKAAELVSYLMSESAANISGRLISAVWDPWPSLHQWSDKLSSSDIYTLRRIVPEDRPQ